MIRWTKESMLAALRHPETGYATCERILWYVWLGQTADERGDKRVRHKNGRGFNDFTVRNGTWIGATINRIVERTGEDNAPWGRMIFDPYKQVIVRKIAEFHAKQGAIVENERIDDLLVALTRKAA